MSAEMALKKEARLAFALMRKSVEMTAAEFAAALAEELGGSVSESQIIDWEKGRRGLKAHTLMAGARVTRQPLSLFLKEPAVEALLSRSLQGQLGPGTGNRE